MGAERFEMRASDADRDRVAEILRDAHGEGRLSQDELLLRVETTYAAKTYQDLDRVIADLPVRRQPAGIMPRPLSAPRPAPRRTGRRIARGLLTGAWWFYGFVVALNLMVWMLVSIGGGGPEYFWPMWVAGPWGLLLGGLEMAYRSRETPAPR
ncbi:DUF1707 domain-containing protein [Jiangella sp. DSM 45060]|uniref:DUF1707 SHOCT-like domain-containing protein n=1 Tax=Jiangella sp. DSM 45060 TaxID=1798224 RepID=UPI00087C83CE|nr:DUF1707 domain-containing protein [Jiangella sp. DSM 45060]SDS02402.1 protein of unknown function [Jiangella sp. DSM 45060]